MRISRNYVFTYGGHYTLKTTLQILMKFIEHNLDTKNFDLMEESFLNQNFLLFSNKQLKKRFFHQNT